VEVFGVLQKGGGVMKCVIFLWLLPISLAVSAKAQGVKMAPGWEGNGKPVAVTQLITERTITISFRFPDLAGMRPGESATLGIPGRELTVSEKIAQSVHGLYPAYSGRLKDGVLTVVVKDGYKGDIRKVATLVILAIQEVCGPVLIIEQNAVSLPVSKKMVVKQPGKGLKESAASTQNRKKAKSKKFVVNRPKNRKIGNG
jgi:hypothetical protein